MKDKEDKQKRKTRKATLDQASPADQTSQGKTFLIVGIGASAGGLEALIELIKNLPADIGMALVVIQHLAPKHASILPELLARESKMPVSQAIDGMLVEKNHVYVIPPNVDMAIYHGRLILIARTKVHGIYMPIDYFFHSLAKDEGNKAIGVVLSGTGSDGSLGLKEIKAEGGITFAQNPDTAEYGDMPRNAIAAGVVDFTLSPAGIVGELVKIREHPYLKGPQAIEAGELAAEAEGDLLSKIFLLLRSATGIDFKLYKPSTIKRRIARRMVVNKIDTLKDYVEYLQAHPPEVESLYQDMLINVTEFFRDSEVFDALRREVFPGITKDKGPEEPIRIWVPGCSTGEEAYSIAIDLLEFLEDRQNKPEIILFATDIDEDAIEKARSGIYPKSIVVNVSPGRLSRFFTPAEDSYQINKVIRDKCIFAKHDITKDPPFSNIDLISFRNVLIYLEPESQKLVIPVLHYALRPGGYLMLGTSEAIGGFNKLFEPVDKKNKIYIRTPAPAKLPAEFISRSRYTPETIVISKVSAKPSGRGLPQYDILKEANHVASELYAPAGVLINDTFEILQFRGDTAPYLKHAPGEPSLNALDMAKEGLQLGLRMAVNDAKRTHALVSKEGIKVKIDGKLRDVSVEVIPIKAPAEELYYYLVFFKEVSMPAGPEVKKPTVGKEKPGEEKITEKSEINELIQELSATKQYLESVVKEKDTASEELRTAYEEIQLRNEEIQSSNEELQSINEELETSKEELQSSNEELTTVNDELQRRNIELTNASDDLNNLFASVDVPVIMLGKELKIRRLTPGAEKVMYVVPGDVGRPISEIKLKVDIPGLERLAQEVIKTLTIKEQEVQDEAGRWYYMQIRPYKTAENRIEGVVIRFVDIDVLRRSLEEIKESNKLNESLTSINLAIGSTLNIDEVMRRIAVESVKTIGCDAASIEMREDASWEVRYVHGLGPEVIGMRFSDEEFKTVLHVVGAKKPVVVNAVEVDQKLTRKVAETFKVRSLMAVPLIIEDEVIGIAMFIYQSSPVVFTEAQIGFAEKLAASVSLALENARLYEEKRSIADTLQTALLNVPKRIEGVEFGYLYRSATEAAKVGGDFFDIFELEHDRVGIVVGDVAGKGLKAAVLTSLVRNTIRAYAYEEASPAAVMAKVNDALIKASPQGSFITVFFGIVDMKSGDLTYCSAGHPPAMIKRGEEVLLLEVNSPVIGAFRYLSFEKAQTTIQEGDMLVLYTDGITEARCDGGFFEEEGLISILKHMKLLPAKEVPQAIFNEVTACSKGIISDDIALLSLSGSDEVRLRA